VSRRRTTAAVAALVLAGVALRLWVAAAAEGKSFSDNAVVALMAMHALRGKLYAFYWGQTYMGSLEALVVAPFFALFGVGDLSLSAGLLPWYVWLAVALFLLARRCGGTAAGFVALVLCALSPPDVQFFEVTARGGYPAMLAFGTTMLWLTLRMVYEPLSDRARWNHAIALGTIGGLAFWTNWLVLPYFAVCAFYLLPADRAWPLRARAWAGAGAFLLGSLPLWWFNWRHGFPTFALASVPDRPPMSETLRWVVELGVPNILGFRDLHGVWALGWVGRALALATAAGVIGALWAQRRCWRALARLRIRDASPAASLWLLVAATISIYVLWLPSRFQVGRYLLPIATASIPLLAIAVSLVMARSRIAGALLLALLVVFYGAATAGIARDFAAATGRYTAGPIEKLAAHLERAGIRCGYAPYSEAAVTTYFMHERAILADYEERYYPRDEIDLRDPALILIDGDAAPTLRSLEASFSEARVGGYRIYWPIRYDGVARVPLPRAGWQIHASVADGDAALMLDGDPWTYWSAAAEAVPIVTVDLGAEVTVAGIDLELGERKKDGFRDLRIDASRDGERWDRVKEAGWDFPLRFRPDGAARVIPDDAQMVLFPPRSARWLRLTLGAANPGHPWSIGELAVFGVAASPVVAFADPTFTDPASPPARERRLWLESARDPASNHSLLALQALYTDSGDQRASAVAAALVNRFTPRTLVQSRFGRDLELVGYDAATRAGRALDITYYWRAKRQMRGVYAMSGHFTGPGTRFQDDYVIGAPARPTNSWRPGEVYKQMRTVEVPEQAPDGLYTLDVGVWDPRTREHLRLDWRGRETRTLLRLAVSAQEVRIEPE